MSINAVLDALAGLQTRRATDPVSRRVIPQLIVRQTDRLNALLRQAPEQHAEVLAAISARGLTVVDHARLNRGLARDLAIVYAALPYADTSANVAARRVRAAGRVVDVVHADLSTVRGLDPSTDAVWLEYLDQRFEVAGKPTLSGAWGRIASFCHQGEAQIIRWQSEKGAYAGLYSRSMFPASHLLAALYKIEHPRTTWTAEFSDPQLRNISGAERIATGTPDQDLLARWAAGMTTAGFKPPVGTNLWEWVEALPYALADTIVFTNPRQRDYMLGYCTDNALAARALTRGQVVPHPVPPPQLYRAVQTSHGLEPGVRHLGYFGTFYATRGLDTVLAALAALAPEEKSQLRLHVFSPDPDQVERAALEAGLAGVVMARPYVGFLEFLNLTTRFDVLLVLDAETASTHGINPYLPSKYADYVGSGRPIWGITERGSMLDEAPLAHRSRLGDLAGTIEVLRELAAPPGR